MICVEVTDRSAVTALAPNATEVVPSRLVPVTVTKLPPAVLPADGDTAVIVGAAAYRKPLPLVPVPPVATTETLTAPALPAGEVATISVSEFAVNVAAAVLPKLTAVAPLNPVPVRVTLVPPANGPPAGEILVITGAGV